ncbi:MAG: type 4a pilus biogenesis protein PilO [Candidatus Omnitrophota bacterium]
MDTKKSPLKINREKLLTFVPKFLQVALTLLFIILVFIPQGRKILRIYGEIREKSDIMVTKERTYFDLVKLKKELVDLEKQAADYDRRLPVLVETNMLIDSLKAITRQSRLKFTSIEPIGVVNFDLPETGDYYYELPIRIKLKCGFFDLLDFMQRIEVSKQLMKVTALAVKSDPESPWEHNVEIVISNFARTNNPAVEVRR